MNLYTKVWINAKWINGKEVTIKCKIFENKVTVDWITSEWESYYSYLIKIKREEYIYILVCFP